MKKQLLIYAAMIFVAAPVLAQWEEEIVLEESVPYKTTMAWPYINDGAVSAAMWFGYYDNIGYDFIDGDAHEQTDAVVDVINFIGTLYDETTTYQIDPNVHVLVDAMRAYLSTRTDDYFIGLMEEKVPRHEGPVAVRHYQYDEVWGSLKKEIKAGRPMLATVDNGFDGVARHILIMVGYRWYYDPQAVPQILKQYGAWDPTLYAQTGWRWQWYTGACYTIHNCGYGIGSQFTLLLLPRLKIFLSNWLRTDCTIENKWCDQSDIDRSGSVDLVDYTIYASHFKEQ